MKDKNIKNAQDIFLTGNSEVQQTQRKEILACIRRKSGKRTLGNQFDRGSLSLFLGYPAG